MICAGILGRKVVRQRARKAHEPPARPAPHESSRTGRVPRVTIAVLHLPRKVVIHPIPRDLPLVGMIASRRPRACEIVHPMCANTSTNINIRCVIPQLYAS